MSESGDTERTGGERGLDEDVPDSAVGGGNEETVPRPAKQEGVEKGDGDAGKGGVEEIAERSD